MVAIVLDSGVSSSGASVTYAVSTAQNRQVVAIVGAQSNTATPNVTSVTLDGQAASELVTHDRGGGGQIHVGIWSVLETDITTGTGLTALMSGTNLDDDGIVVVVLQNCSQEAPEDTDVTDDVSTSTTRTLTTQDGSLLVDGLFKRNINNVTAGADQTEQADLGFFGEGLFASTQAGSDGGVMSASWTGSVNYTYVAVSFIGVAFAFVPRVTVF